MFTELLRFKLRFSFAFESLTLCSRSSEIRVCFRPITDSHQISFAPEGSEHPTRCRNFHTSEDSKFGHYINSSRGAAEDVCCMNKQNATFCPVKACQPASPSHCLHGMISVGGQDLRRDRSADQGRRPNRNKYGRAGE